MRTLLISIFMFVQCTPAYASETPQVCTDAQEVTSPCHGVLLPPKAAADALKCLKVDLPRAQSDLKAEKKTSSVMLQTRDQIIKQQKLHIKNQDALLDRSLALAAKSPKTVLDSPAFWVAVGLVVGVAGTVAITYAVNQ